MRRDAGYMRQTASNDFVKLNDFNGGQTLFCLPFLL